MMAKRRSGFENHAFEDDLELRKVTSPGKRPLAVGDEETEGIYESLHSTDPYNNFYSLQNKNFRCRP